MKKLLIAALVTSTISLTQAEDPELFAVSEFTFEFDEPWVQVDAPSPMRAGEFKYDFEDEGMEDVNLVVYFFGKGQGGGTQANIDRWIGQFEGTPETNTEVKQYGEKEVTYLTASGTYMESMGGPFSGNKTAKPDSMMLAAILPSPQGDVFLKITGPKASVEAMRDDYMAFAESALDE